MIEGCSVASLAALLAWLWDHGLAILGAVGTVVWVASEFCAATPTPKPGSRLANLYRVVEIVARVVRHAKETGALPTTKADRALEEAIEAIRKGKT